MNEYEFCYLRHLVSKGAVAKGAKNDRADCFYITEVGKQIIEAEGKVSEND